jgi:hypothetical protein
MLIEKIAPNLPEAGHSLRQQADAIVRLREQIAADKARLSELRAKLTRDVKTLWLREEIAATRATIRQTEGS